jgi:starch-binding outer membrane protein, SusD/RagB family
MKMMKGLLGSLLTVMIVVGCSDYVQNVEAPIASVSNTEINTPQDLQPFVVGLQTMFTQVYSEGSLNNGGISDELIFDRRVVGATFPQYDQINNAGVTVLVPGNNSVQNAWRSLTQYRLLADTLITRANSLTYADAADSALRTLALFNGYLHSAIARTMMADEYSHTFDGDGAGVVLGNGPLVMAPELRAQAIAQLDKAIQHASPAQAAMCHTLKARAYLYLGDFANAKASADMGMASGAAPLQARHNSASRNEWFDAAGAGRNQFMAAQRFKAYVDSVPSEAGRIPLRAYNGRGGTVWYQQNKYTTFESTIDYVTWQENHLMLAELAIRNSDNATALQLINEVRASHGVVDLTDAAVQADFGGDYLEAIFVERDKELCFTGRRGMDQIRFDKWHLDPATTWKRLPISQDERQGNPNFD